MHVKGRILYKAREYCIRIFIDRKRKMRLTQNFLRQYSNILMEYSEYCAKYSQIFSLTHTLTLNTDSPFTDPSFEVVFIQGRVKNICRWEKKRRPMQNFLRQYSNILMEYLEYCAKHSQITLTHCLPIHHFMANMPNSFWLSKVTEDWLCTVKTLDLELQYLGATKTPDLDLQYLGATKTPDQDLQYLGTTKTPDLDYIPGSHQNSRSGLTVPRSHQNSQSGLTVPESHQTDLHYLGTYQNSDPDLQYLEPQTLDPDLQYLGIYQNSGSRLMVPGSLPKLWIWTCSTWEPPKLWIQTYSTWEPPKLQI